MNKHPQPNNKVIIGLFLIFHFFSLAAQEDLLLKDYEPISIYKTQVSSIQSAKFPAVDFHTHPYAKTEEELKAWVSILEKSNIKKTIILTYNTGASFDSLYHVYSKYDSYFELWCGIDYSGYNEIGWSQKAVKELERCYEVGAKGVGELGDKGLGLFYSKPSPAYGMHIDDKRLYPVLQKCGDLGMPVSIHVADPLWMYLPMDKHNDGLMNAYEWRIDSTEEDLLSHEELINTLDNAASQNPNTIFIACHFANCSHDLRILANLMDENANLYADISARFGETAPIPRHVKAFYEKYKKRLLYGTDMGISPDMYQTTFRILESEDEHFYNRNHFTYHWPLHGFGLKNSVLKKLYSDNAKKILK